MKFLLFYYLTLAGITYCVEVRVKEDEVVILPCSFGSTNIQSETFDWKKDDQKNVFMYQNRSHYNNGRPGQDPQFKGRVFHFEDQLQSGNASIVIRNTKTIDRGNYSCIFPYHQPTTRSMIELIVGSCPEPSVTIHHQTNDQALLECKVQGAFPKPKVQWLDSDNKTVPAEEPQVTESEGEFNIILNANVTKTDNYRCVSTQEEICHKTVRKIQVTLHGAPLKPTIGPNTGLIVALVVVIVIAAVVIIAVCFYFKKDKPETSVPLLPGSDAGYSSDPDEQRLNERIKPEEKNPDAKEPEEVEPLPSGSASDPSSDPDEQPPNEQIKLHAETREETPNDQTKIKLMPKDVE